MPLGFGRQFIRFIPTHWFGGCIDELRLQFAPIKTSHFVPPANFAGSES